MPRTVVLYNPRAVFFTMPLALVAIGSALDRLFEVRIVDGRLEADPEAALLRAIDGALCLGVTVLTGTPIREALAITRAAKACFPALPVIWGGWHPSLFPTDTLAEAGVDAVVAGQGERTFAEIVERLAEGRPLAGIAGCWLPGEPPPPPQPLADVNELPPHDYALIDAERYFERKGERQLDYIASQGCRFRCTFCADPYVYKRAWSGLAPERIAEELAGLERRYGITDVGFQDETFFTSASRVAAIAEALAARDCRFTWMATMRADQGERLDEAILAAARRAGLRRVMIGVESGDQRTLAAIRKDITLAQVEAAAEKCRRAGVAALFNFIVGFPGEDEASVDATIRLARRLRRISPSFEVAIFYFKPYPGNPIADALARTGWRFPATLAEWSEFDYVGAPNSWISAAARRRVEGFKFYQRLAYGRPRALRAPVRALARLRCERDFYSFPVEKAVLEWLRPPQDLS